MRVFLFKKLILIIIKMRLMGYWKSLIILQEIKKPSGKSLRVWVKNQLRFEIFEKVFKFTYQNLRNGGNVPEFPSHSRLYYRWSYTGGPQRGWVKLPPRKRKNVVEKCVIFKRCIKRKGPGRPECKWIKNRFFLEVSMFLNLNWQQILNGFSPKISRSDS